MNNKFTSRLEEYLISECSECDILYEWEWCEDTECCVVKLENQYLEDLICINFRYNAENDYLLIELSEDCFYETREFDSTVKYFWMVVAPALFAINNQRICRVLSPLFVQAKCALP